MRNNWWAAAAVAGVLVFGMSASARPERKPAARKPAPREAESRKTELVHGWGRDRDTAVEAAERHACDRVKELMVAKYGEGWAPPPRLLEPEALKRHGVITLEGEPGLHPDLQNAPENDARIMAVFKVDLTPDYLAEVRKAAREERVEARHLIFVRGLGAAVLLLLVTASYLRLEEWTRGYATRLLRAAAAAVVLLAGVLLWLTW